MIKKIKKKLKKNKYFLSLSFKSKEETLFLQTSSRYIWAGVVLHRYVLLQGWVRGRIYLLD